MSLHHQTLMDEMHLNDTNESKLNMIGDELKVFVNDTTLHGMKHLSRSTSFRSKVFWALLLAASITYCIIGNFKKVY